MTAVNSSLLDDCYRLLSKTKSNVVWEILRQSKPFYEWNHYPEGDTYDNETHSQYYYHAHPQDNTNRWDEHGHFHLFIRRKGIPEKYQPIILPSTSQDSDDDGPCHICAISMDKFGKPIRLFTTNRWVTGEAWYSADDICQFISHFAITHAWPSWPTNIWLTQIVHEYQEAIATLLIERDRKITEWQTRYPDKDVYEDRNLEVTSFLELPQ